MGQEAEQALEPAVEKVEAAHAVQLEAAAAPVAAEYLPISQLAHEGCPGESV